MLKEFFQREGIFCHAELMRGDLAFSDEKRLSRLEEKMGRVASAVIFLMPYFASEEPTNLSYYVRPRDYHGFVKDLEDRLKAYFEEKGEKTSFAVCADTSPLDERLCAAKAGLGILGDNGLLIHEKYGSWVFIGAVFLSRPISPVSAIDPAGCLHCGQCKKACPTDSLKTRGRERCLSHLTQKKKRTPEEDALVFRAPYRWGCDLCQLACPMNREALSTPIPYFQRDRLDSLTLEAAELCDEEFFRRAFSWRGREIIIRNLKGEE